MTIFNCIKNLVCPFFYEGGRDRRGINKISVEIKLEIFEDEKEGFALIFDGKELDYVGVVAESF